MFVNRKVVSLPAEQDSKEMVSKIFVKSDQPVTKGTVLWEFDKRPNQIVMNQAAAALKVEVQQQTYVSSQATVDQAFAAVQEAKSAVSSAWEGLKSDQMQLSHAELNIQQNEVIAPADGYIMNMQIAEGTMGTSTIAAPMGVFVDMSETLVAAVFPQNLLANVEPGNLVEIAFKSRPGQVTTGEVVDVLEFSGERQFIATGVLPIATDERSKGKLLVSISPDDKEATKELAMGGGGTTAIYPNSGKLFQAITMRAIGVKAWANYLPV